MNWSRSLSMGGYAFYVWVSYALTLTAIAGEVLLLRRRQKALRSKSKRPAGTT